MKAEHGGFSPREAAKPLKSEKIADKDPPD